MARTLAGIDAQLRATRTRIAAIRQKLDDQALVMEGLRLRRTRFHEQLTAEQARLDALLDERQALSQP
jgi:hypothetical protein